MDYAGGAVSGGVQARVGTPQGFLLWRGKAGRGEGCAQGTVGTEGAGHWADSSVNGIREHLPPGATLGEGVVATQHLALYGRL